MSDSNYPYGPEDIKVIIRKYRNLLAGQPDSFLDSEEFEWLVQHFEEEEKYNKALQCANDGLNQYRGHPGLLLDKANVLLLLHQFEEALTVLETFPQNEEFNTNLILLRTEGLLALDRIEEANVILKNAIALPYHEELVETFFELADVYDSFELFESVFTCMAHILTLDPNSEEALYKIGFWTDYTGNYEESISIHNKIIDEFPYSELAWFNLGLAYQGLKLHEKAIDAYQYCLAIDDSLEIAHRNIGDAYLRLRKYDLAIDTLSKLLEFATPESVIYEAIGHCYDKKKQFVTARKYYKKASHLDPEDSSIIYKIAQTYISEHKWKTAIEFLTVASKMTRLHPDYHIALGQCYAELGNYTEAITSLGIVIRTRPRNKSAWIALLNCLFMEGDYVEGLEYAEFASAQTDKKPIFKYYQFLFQFVLGNINEAILILDTAMQMSPKLIKQMVELHPALLHNANIIEVIAKFKNIRKG